MIKRRGLMLILSSPSGAGKTSIVKRILEEDASVQMSVSVTTRPKRIQETNGVDYFFVSSEKFSHMLSDQLFLESATVFGNSYGTPRAFVMDKLQQGCDVIFDLDWQGTQQIVQKHAQDTVTVFVLPPSVAELEKRLRGRASDSDDVVKRRMAEASSEMSHWPEYDYVIVNNTLDESVAQVQRILESERLRKIRQQGLSDFVSTMRQSIVEKRVT